MSYKYINEKTIFPSFFQYPEFLLHLPISQTGKTVYMLLYDLARLSQKNNWMDEDGRIFVIFPTKELAKKLEKSETTIKTALNELDEAGLLQRKSGGFSKPNHIFLKIMTEVENSVLGENQTVEGSDNCLSYGKKCDCDKVSSPAPNKVIEKSNYSKNNRDPVMEKELAFLGMDGLLHCNVCKEPLEVFYPQGSLLEGRKHHRQCACERKAYVEDAKYHKEKEHRELVARNRGICFEEKEMKNWTFQNADEENRLMKIAKDYVANWEEMKRKHMGYLLWGPIGTGKSYLAGCIANALLEQEVTVKMTNFNTILNDLFEAEEKSEYIRAIAGYELLIIDDLGVERSSEYALENIFSVIDRRYRSRKPLIVTTNLPLSKLKAETDVDKKRIYDRILEMCIPLKIDGNSRREAIANDNVHAMKKILDI